MSGAKEKLFPLEISRLWRNSYSHIFNLVFNKFFTFMVQRLKKGSQTQIAPEEQTQRNPLKNLARNVLVSGELDKIPKKLTDTPGVFWHEEERTEPYQSRKPKRRGQDIKEKSKRCDNLQTDTSNESREKIKMKTRQEKKPVSKEMGSGKESSIFTPTWKQLQELFPDMSEADWQSIAEEAGTLGRTGRSKSSKTGNQDNSTTMERTVPDGKNAITAASRNKSYHEERRAASKSERGRSRSRSRQDHRRNRRRKLDDERSRRRVQYSRSRSGARDSSRGRTGSDGNKFGKESHNSRRRDDIGRRRSSRGRQRGVASDLFSEPQRRLEKPCCEHFIYPFLQNLLYLPLQNKK